MSVSELIGKIVALYLRNELAENQGTNSDGTARYIIDCLSQEQTAAIAKSILQDPVLSNQIDLKLPQHFLAGIGLPADILTMNPATYYRNAASSMPVLVVANTGDEEEQSLKEFTRIGAPELQDQPDLWIEVASDGLGLPPDHTKWWTKALSGLQELRLFSLDRLGAYILRTRQAISEEGLPLLHALGAGLPALHFPKDTVLWTRVKEKARGHASAWKTVYGSVAKSRACYLLKQTPAQLLLNQEDLQLSFDVTKDIIPEAVHKTILAFIGAPSGWNSAAAQLAEFEWEVVKPLFDGMKREKFNLGRETFTLYEDREPGILNEEEREYLKRLSDRPATEPTDEDASFYEAHRNELKEERKLKSAWDRFIFGKPRETEDFLAGIAASLESLFNQESSGLRRRLRIRCDRATKKDLRDLNVNAGLYFARRYAGLQGLLGNRVSWSVGQLFSFPALVESWKSTGRSPLNYSTARAALQLKFLLDLEVELTTGGTQNYSTQLIWKFNPNTVVSQFYDDWSRLLDHPLVICRVNRDLIGAKGRFQTIDLSNVRTFVPAYDRDRGSFVPVYRKVNDIAMVWRCNLEDAKSQRFITAIVAQELAEKFDAFELAYTEAIQEFCEIGASHPSIAAQLSCYAALLAAICRCAQGDRNRDLLLRPLLDIGTAGIDGGPPAAVVTPWHPLRLVAMQRKAHHVAGLVHHLLTTDEVFFGDTRLFFKDLDREMAHPFYPELVLGWINSKPELLALSDVVQDYSLHEAPTIGTESVDDTNENPSDGSNCVLEMVQRYLTLHPHEQANMSVVLYNCDSARLPQAVVEKLGSLYEDEDNIHCQVFLRHGDAGRLRELYKAIISLSDADPDKFNPSEATQDFMARLRICIIADEAPPPNPKDGCPYDVVFCQDVIARHARIEWYTENARAVKLETLVPARWSRRRPAARDDMKSVVYLCCPVQSAEGWIFLTAITSFLKGDWDGLEDRRLLPARQLDFRDPKTARIFEETHNLGNWVVNYDELLDRRQLLNQNVRVIRYKQSATQGRNIVISSRASLSLLRSMVLSRIKTLNLGLGEEEAAIAERFIQDANDISGDIVLRAAKRGRNASELMGIVLSRYIVRNELGLERYHGWYFLDDYASWLGQREEQIADILVLSPERTAKGTYRLSVVITEAKYIEVVNLAAKRKESQKQLRDTMKRINEAVFGSPTRLDRELWLARLSDLILDGVQFPASANINLADWRRAIREGECEISVRGYSHIFVSDPNDATDCSSFARVAGLDSAYQEVFGRSLVRELVQCYARNADPAIVLGKLTEGRPWEEETYRKPTDLTATNVVRRLRHEEREDEEGSPSSAEISPAPPQSRGPAGETADFKAEASSPPNRGGTNPSDDAKWAYPEIGRLITKNLMPVEDEDDKAWVKQTENRMKNALQQFQLQAKLLRSVLTPNCVILKFSGSANLTVEQVRRRHSEFLTTHGLNLISIQPEPGVVSLAIERPTRRVIKTQELWERWHPAATEGGQELLIGMREDDGELLMLSPGKHAPHTLIAGSTGSGKSVLMQNIILGVAATNTPQQASIILIDPKQGVDYYQFEYLPHLKAGIIDDQERASQELEALVMEMDARYMKLRSARVTNLAAYNQKVPIPERIPFIWLIHDEFAEWMLVEEYKQHVTGIVSRLGIKARAAGIYLVFAAQRPDANVMPMQLRANLGNRLILKVDSEGTSEIALGEVGAERLLGRGHLLAKLEGIADLCYAQVPLAEPGFVEQVVALIRHDKPLS